MPSVSWFRPSTPPLVPLPSGIERQYVATPSGSLELLVTNPNVHGVERKQPLFFAHGGCGSAAVWLEFMTYFASKGIPCYAVSYRGHGASWYPKFFRMFFTTKRT